MELPGSEKRSALNETPSTQVKHWRDGGHLGIEKCSEVPRSTRLWF